MHDTFGKPRKNLSGTDRFHSDKEIDKPTLKWQGNASEKWFCDLKNMAAILPIGSGIKDVNMKGNLKWNQHSTVFHIWN